MPQATALVIKNAAGVDKTFSLDAPAAGYAGVAEWSLKEGATPNVFPRVTLSATPTRQVRATKVVLTVPFAYNDPATGLPIVGDTFLVDLKVKVPNGFPVAMRDDAVAYTKGVISDALVAACYRDGNPAT